MPQQTRSYFAHNAEPRAVIIENPRITREMVDRAARNWARELTELLGLAVSCKSNRRVAQLRSPFSGGLADFLVTISKPAGRIGDLAKTQGSSTPQDNSISRIVLVRSE